MSSKPAGKGRTVEQTYQKLTQLEHILLRPDTYIGSVEAVTQPMWVYDKASKRMQQRTLTYVPGLYKIFDEIMVNAADNKQRDGSMDTLKVEISREKGTISVYNNGQGIPVELHKEHGCYVPELVFGHLLTSSNYDDDEAKVTGGRNGYGAKLANIFSTEFVVETSDLKTGLQYKQTFSDNMRSRSKPSIKPTTKPDWTRITFKPDLAKFGMTELDDDICALMARRVVDLAGCTDKSVKVFLDGERVPVADFKSYVDLYIGIKGAEGAKARVFEKVSSRWEVCVAPSDEGFTQVSFVNSIATTKGGKHVDHVTEQLVAKLMEVLKKKDKSAAALKPHQVKGHLAVFINCLITNPAFDSQTKENMTLVVSKFGSKCELDDKFLKNMASCGMVESILDFLNHKNQKDLCKTNKGKRERLTGISKLDDANEAGGRNSRRCTLILTEGDSAKALAVSGLSVIGRDYFGVFPLRGKLLNVRDASTKQVTENAEITHIKQIMGLQHGKKYNDDASLNTLRYGHLMIMTDQDHDGSHIKGLVINFLHVYWPELLQHNGFLQEFVTPIVKATKGKKEIPFFTLPEYEAWREAETNARGWSVKYYKGLGTSTSAEAKEYFSDLPKHELTFEWQGERDSELIELAFSKKKADERKVWLQGYVAGTHVDHSQNTLPYDDFINKELILFSRADNVRSIPNMVDGFKPGQRKILFGCFKRKLKNEVKVAQLSGYIGEHSAYHHGEVSLHGTIVNMAQDYVGANNINLLHPAGQFGTRLQGGKDHASARYIFTRLSPITRAIFPEADDPVLTYLEDDGIPIEPTFYVPILPMVLVNGADGIGTGWATSVPNYNPSDIVVNLRRMMDGLEPEPMAPWYRGFNGAIEPSKAGSYQVTGKIEQIDATTVKVTELPLRKWTQDYKETLEGLMAAGKEGEAFVTDFKEHHTDTTVSFTISLSENSMAAALSEGLLKKFKLVGSLAESNLVLWDEHGRMKKYEGTGEILREFYAIRQRTYAKRKAWLTERLGNEWEKLRNKARFIQAVVDSELVIAKKTKAALVELLRAHKYLSIPNEKKAGIAGVDAEGSEAADDASTDADAGSSGGYDYLLSMPLWSLSAERLSALRAECDAKEAELNALLGKTPLDLWRTDLDNFETVYAEFVRAKEQADAESAAVAAKARKGGPSKPRAPSTKPAAKSKSKSRPTSRAASSEDESESEAEDSDDDFEEHQPKQKKRPAAPKPAAAEQAPKPLASIFAKAAAAAAPKPAAVEPVPKPLASIFAKAAGGSSASAPKPKAAAAAKPKPKAPAADFDLAAESDEDAEGGTSLMARLAARPAAPKPAASKAAAAAAKPMAIDLEDEDEFGFTDGPPSAHKPVVAKPAAKPRAKPVPKRKLESDDDDDSEPAAKPRAKPVPKPESDDDDDSKPAIKPPVKRKQKAVAESDDDSEYGEPVKAAKPKPAAKPKAAAAPKPKLAATVAAAKPKPAAKPKCVMSDDDMDDDDAEVMAAAPPADAGTRRPARQAAVSSRGKMQDADSEEDDDEDASASEQPESDAGSEYAGSD